MILKQQPRAPLSIEEEEKQMKENMDRFFKTKSEQNGPGPQTLGVLRDLSEQPPVLHDHLSQLLPMAAQLIRSANHQSRLILICIQLIFSYFPRCERRLS